MRDFERVMLAIYEAMIESSKPYVEVKPLLASLNLPQESNATIMMHQRGFIGSSPVGSICLSGDGMAYVEEWLLECQRSPRRYPAPLAAT
jgi:hypothetical protein